MSRVYAHHPGSIKVNQMHFFLCTFYLSVNVFSTKVLIGDTIFTSPNGDETAIFKWSSEPREGLAACSAKDVPSFLSHFKTLSNGPAPGIEPATFRSAVKRSTDWANPSTVKWSNGCQNYQVIWVCWGNESWSCFRSRFHRWPGDSGLFRS